MSNEIKNLNHEEIILLKTICEEGITKTNQLKLYLADMSETSWLRSKTLYNLVEKGYITIDTYTNKKANAKKLYGSAYVEMGYDTTIGLKTNQTFITMSPNRIVEMLLDVMGYNLLTIKHVKDIVKKISC